MNFTPLLSWWCLCILNFVWEWLLCKMTWGDLEGSSGKLPPLPFPSLLVDQVSGWGKRDIPGVRVFFWVQIDRASLLKWKWRKMETPPCKIRWHLAFKYLLNYSLNNWQVIEQGHRNVVYKLQTWFASMFPSKETTLFSISALSLSRMKVAGHLQHIWGFVVI